MIKVLRSPKCFIGGELAGSCCFEFLWELGVEVRPRQASMLACIVLAGIREGLVSPKEF